MTWARTLLLCTALLLIGMGVCTWLVLSEMRSDANHIIVTIERH
jgi:hypothetical protein